MRLVAAIFFASAALCQAAGSVAGRWEGSAQIPGAELKLVVDLSEEGGKGWVGSRRQHLRGRRRDRPPDLEAAH